MATPIWPQEGVAVDSTGDMVANSLADRVVSIQTTQTSDSADITAIKAVTDVIPDAGALTVPTADAAANVTWGDAIGNKNDTHDGTSLAAFAHTIDEHAHTAQMVYPTLADGISLATAAGDWALGALTQIVPASTIGDDFDIHEVVIEDVNTQGKTYELILYAGGGDTEVGRTRFSASANKGGVPNATMQTPIIAADSRIRGRLAIQDGGSKTAVVSIRYHVY
jgi:hypothetical protein